MSIPFAQDSAYEASQPDLYLPIHSEMFSSSFCLSYMSEKKIITNPE